MQDINWPLIYAGKERFKMLKKAIDKVLVKIPITQKDRLGLKPLRFELVNALVLPQEQELHLILKPKGVKNGLVTGTEPTQDQGTEGSTKESI